MPGELLSGRALGLLAAGTAGGMLLTVLQAPVGGLLGAVLGSALYAAARPGVALPRPYRLLGMAVIGTVSGASVAVGSLRSLVDAAVPLVGALVVLVAAWLLLTWVLVRRFGLEPLTALYAAAPGGLSEISSLAVDAPVHARLVITIHLARVVLLVVAGLPVLVWWLELGGG